MARLPVIVAMVVVTVPFWIPIFVGIVAWNVAVEASERLGDWMER